MTLQLSSFIIKISHISLLLTPLLKLNYHHACQNRERKKNTCDVVLKHIILLKQFQ